MNTTATNILKNNLYCTVSTVTADGAPWASPVHFAYDDHNVYWLSHDEAVHSLNIRHDGRVFIVVFDSRQTVEMLDDRGAVYISTHASKLEGEAAIAARDIYADRFPDDNDRKLSEWSMYCAPIGELDDIKTKGHLVYFRYDSEASE